MNVGRIALAGSAFALALDANTASQTGTLDVAVGGVRDSSGRIHVEICPQKDFLAKCPFAYNAPAHAGTTVVTATNLPFGTYAAQVYHDENSNGKVDRTFLGIPIEGVGFSNDAPIKLAPPKYSAAMFNFTKSGQTIGLKLRYFLGRSR